jgi:hypothetical protein
VVFDFKTEWRDVPADVKDAWAQKCKEIEDAAVRVVSLKHGADYDNLRSMFHMDPQKEWESIPIPISDDDWIYVAAAIFEDEMYPASWDV